MPEMERDLLAVLEQNPADDETRYVLADWLEEQGRTQDAELVRVFLERKNMHAGAADVAACSQRLAELATASQWIGRRLVLRDPSLRTTEREFIDPPWTAFEPLRLGSVPRGLGTPDRFVCVESDTGPVLRIDVYDWYRSHHRSGAMATPGLVFVGYASRVVCVEPYGRRCSVLELDARFDSCHSTTRALLVTSTHSVYRLTDEGTILWQSVTVGNGGVRIHGEDDLHVEGEGHFEDWDSPPEWRNFRLDLATGELLNQTR